MRISFVCTDDLPRGGRARRQAKALAEAGHVVTVHGVLSGDAEPEEDDGDVVLVRTPPAKAARSALRLGVPRRAAAPPWAPAVRHALVRDPPQAIQVFGTAAAADVAAAAAAAGIPFLLDDDGGPVAGAAGPATDSAVAPAPDDEARVRRAAVACIAASDALAADAAARCGCPRPAVVHDSPPLRRVARGDLLRTKLGIHPRDRIVVFHAPPDAAHGIDVAVRAVGASGERAVLVVVGPARTHDDVLRRAAEAGALVQVRVAAAETPGDAVRLVACGDVAVLPLSAAHRRTRLGIPCALLETFLAGVPVVVSDVPGAAGLVRRTSAGIVARTGAAIDPAEVGIGVRALLADADLLEGCGLAAAAAARRDFHWEKDATRLVDLYDRISSAM